MMINIAYDLWGIVQDYANIRNIIMYTLSNYYYTAARELPINVPLGEQYDTRKRRYVVTV